MLQIFNCLREESFIAQHRRETSAFSRVRKLPFRLLVLFLINQVKGALQREIDDFFERALACTQRVSAAALCVARQALSPSAFVALNQRLVQLALQSTEGVLFHGRRVLACDGSTLNLLRSQTLFAAFGGQVQAGRPLPMARVLQVVDVGSGITLSASLSPYALGEQVLAAEAVAELPEATLTLYDRGFFSFFLLAWHRHCRRDFLLRLPRGACPEADRLFVDADAPRHVTLQPNATARKLLAEAAADGQPIDASPLSLRLVRVLLPTGEVEVLATSLTDAEACPEAEFLALYAKRWAVETDFRTQKTRLQMENPTGRKALTVHQDFHARVLAKNLVQLLVAWEQQGLDQARNEALAKGQSASRHRSRINLVDALHLAKFVLVHAIALGVIEPIVDYCQRLHRHRHCERKDRSFPRLPSRAKIPRWPMAYKQSA